MQPAGGVEDHHVVAGKPARLHRALGDVDRPLPLHDRQGGDVDLLAEDLELLLRRRPVDVERRHQDLLLVLLLEAARELRGRGGLTGALQPHHHQRLRRLAIEAELLLLLVGAQHLDQLVMDDLDHLLAGGDGFQDLLADGLLPDPTDEVLDDRQRDVGFQQRHAYVAHRRLDVALLESAARGEALQGLAEPIRQRFEHQCRQPSKQCSPWGKRLSRQCANLADWRSPPDMPVVAKALHHA